MNTLRSGQVRYPGNRWGAFADDPALDVGIAGEAWVAPVAHGSSPAEPKKNSMRLSRDMQRMRSSSLGFSWHNADQPRCLPPQVRTVTAQRLQQNASLSPLSEDAGAQL